MTLTSSEVKKLQGLSNKRRLQSDVEDGGKLKMLTKTELTITADMLELAADEFSNHGCNDYDLPNTSDNLQFVRQMIAAGDYPEDQPHVYGDAIAVSDVDVMRYCVELLRMAAAL